MKYRVTFYCPDRHVQYDAGRTPDKKGVGGGVTARIRLAQALVRNGHNVAMICNCHRAEVHLGVHYIPLNQAKEIETDILLLSTSGDALSLEPLLDLKFSSQLKILLIYGTPRPKGIDAIGIDFYYPPSNFIRQVMLTEWGEIPQEKIFVTYFGVVKRNFERSNFSATLIPRNRFRLAYVGHPSKGRDAAIGILGILQKMDPRYHLHVFGDERLWGGKRGRLKFTRGVKNYGMINQQRLAQELLTCSYAIFLQARLEPYANVTLEALSAGCIPIASPIGGFKEQLIQGWNGFFVAGPHNDPSTWHEAARLIHELNSDPARADTISRNARESTYAWDVVAQSWEEHWERVLNPNTDQSSGRSQPCPHCTKTASRFADGFHCSHCGYFSQLARA
jgi:glycosyltransferase involved in cell wall biosynthesis